MTLQDCIQNFLDHVKEIEQYDDNDVDGYSKEFKKLTLKSRKNITEKVFPATHGEMGHNLPKNRYKDILPYDHSRVTLSERDGEPGSDYINANFVVGATGHKTYIAAQGPQPNTVNDFWRMLWEYKTFLVIMACNEYEGIKLKCKRYWPKEDEDLDFGGIHVTLVEEKQNDEYILRVIQACVGEDVRLLYQFHYIAWPDHGTPTNLEQILDMIALARQYQRLDVPPIVVHCSAGCGRTGTILAIDYTWSLLKLGKLAMNFSLYNLIVSFRTQRQSIVQSEDQYIFVHMAVRELFQRHLALMDEHLYENVLTVDGACEQDTVTDEEQDIYQDVCSPTTHSTTPTTNHTPPVRLKQPPPIPNNQKQQPGSRTQSTSSTTSTVESSNRLRSEKLSSSDSNTSPKPPPKPERIFLTDISPTKTTIMQTITRLMSGSLSDVDDLEDSMYVNMAEFKLSKPIPKWRKGKKANTQEPSDNTINSKTNEEKSSSSVVKQSPTAENSKPAVGQKPTTPVKPSIARKPASESGSRSSKDSTDASDISGTLPKQQRSSSNEKGAKLSSGGVSPSISKDLVEGKTVCGLKPVVNIKTKTIQDEEKPDVALPRRGSPLPAYENVTDEDVQKNRHKDKPKPMKKNDGAEVIQHSYENMDKEVGSSVNNAKDITSVDKSSNGNQEQSNVKHSGEKSNVNHGGDNVKVNVKDRLKHWSSGATPEIQSEKKVLQRQRSEGMSGRTAVKPNVAGKDFIKDAKLGNDDKQDKKQQQKNEPESVSTPSGNSPVAPPRSSSNSHKVTIDMSGNQDNVEIKNSTRISRLDDHPAAETVHQGGVKQKRTGFGSPANVRKNEYVRTKERAYEEIWTPPADEKPVPKGGRVGGSGKSIEGSNTGVNIPDDGEYMEVCVGARQPLPKPKSTTTSSTISTQNYKQTDQSNSPLLPSTKDLPVDNDEVFNSEDSDYEQELPPVPSKSFQGSDDSASLNTVDFGGSGSNSATKTMGRKIGKQFRKVFAKDKEKTYTLGTSTSGANKGTSDVVFKGKNIGFGKRLHKPKGPRSEGTGKGRKNVT